MVFYRFFLKVRHIRPVVLYFFLPTELPVPAYSLERPSNGVVRVELAERVAFRPSCSPQGQPCILQGGLYDTLAFRAHVKEVTAVGYRTL